MLALRAARFVVGVKVAVRVRPVPLMAPSVPPVTTTSPELPSQLKPVGVSLKLKVIVAVLPAVSAATLLVIASVDARVSTARVGVVPATPALPAESV